MAPPSVSRQPTSVGLSLSLLLLALRAAAMLKGKRAEAAAADADVKPVPYFSLYRFADKWVRKGSRGVGQSAKEEHA
jgi:ABC-type sugar transport system substrate-binding protein